MNTTVYRYSRAAMLVVCLHGRLFSRLGRAGVFVGLSLPFLFGDVHAAEIQSHHIPSVEMSGNPDADGWFGMVRSLRTKRYFVLDFWNPMRRRWEPSILPARFGAKGFWAGADTQLPHAGFDSIRAWVYSGSEPCEVQVTGVAFLDEPNASTTGVKVAIRHSTRFYDLSTLWKAQIPGRVGVQYRSHDLRLTMEPGEMLLFVVSAQGNHEGDLTRWPVDIALSAAPREEALATEEFHLGDPQGDPSSWRYSARRRAAAETVDLVSNQVKGLWEMAPEYNEPLLQVLPGSQHPGKQWDSVRSWTYQGKGEREVRIVGRVELSTANQGGQDGVVVSVEKKSRSGSSRCLWERRLNARQHSSFPQFGDHDLVTTVRQGDEIRFIVGAGPNRNAFFDLTIWDPTIRVYDFATVSSTSRESPVIGRRETAASKLDRDSNGLSFWPDGPLGYVRESDGSLSFYGPNGCAQAHTSGGPGAPLRLVHDNSVPIHGVPPENTYVSGGIVFKAPPSEYPDLLLLFYHSEAYPSGDFRRYYSRIGLAVRRSDGSFQNLGYVFEPEYVGLERAAVVWSGTYVIHTDPADGIKYFYLYTEDTLADGSAVAMTVARAPYAEVLDAASRGTTSPWFKYYIDSEMGGGFSQPAVGHYPSSSIFSDRVFPRQAVVSYNTFLEKYLMAVSIHDEDFLVNGNINLFLYTSEDAIHWEELAKLEDEAFESFYCSLIGTEPRSYETGDSFFVYYTRSIIGGIDGFARFEDATLARRRVSFRDPRPPLEGDATGQ